MNTPMLPALIVIGTSLIAPIAGATDQPQPTTPAAAADAPKSSGRVPVKGVNYHYEIRGQGEPLLLLHGGLMSGDLFAPVVPTLTAGGRQVITIDLQGHGRTNLGDRPIRCDAIADDVAAVLTKIGRTKLDVLGYSFGGCVALRLGVQHPDRVRRLALVSTPYADDGWYAHMRPQQHGVSAALMPMMKDTPMYAAYKAVAPKDDFPKLLDAMGDLMRHRYDWSAEVSKLKMPVQLVYGDGDMVRPEHIVKFYQLLGGGLRDAGWNRENMPRNRLAIIPDLTHYDMFSTPRIAETVLLRFFKGESGAPTSAPQAQQTKAEKRPAAR
jgi:pimeloyl-ACP methyl ester carboxylesterase